MKVILASASPRRKEILQQMGIEFSVIPADTDENISLTDPAGLVEELSRRKADAVADQNDEDSLVIGADTVVWAAGQILGKPKDEQDAFRMIKLLSGSTHKVFTGVTVRKGKQISTSHCVTDVTFRPMTDDEISKYISSTEPYDKAGGYAVQGQAARYITGINGCFFNVVGFPVSTFFDMLDKMGITLI